MSKNPETLFKEKVTARLRKEFEDEIYFFKVQQVSQRGIPDLVICLRGKFIAWELKTNTGRATDLQLYNLQKIATAGGIAKIVTPKNFEEEITCLKNL